jgi:cell division protein FtsI/penicillin-binding protein 2
VRPGVGRLLVLLIGFAGFVCLLIAKLVSIQIVDHQYYRTIAVRQHGYLRPIPAKRGTIFDRNRRVLAKTLPAYRVYADPYLIGDAEYLASSVGKVVRVDVPRLTRQLSGKKSHYVLIDLALDVERALEIKRLGLEGVVVEPVGERVRPFGEAASNIIGCFSIYEEPLSGIEREFNDLLKGKPGLRRHLRDARGRPVPCVEAIVDMPVAGHSLILTIDMNLQLIAETALDQAVADHGAKGGCVVIADPVSGEILAMASNPKGKNLPVRAVFEPGSALKICTYASALDLGKIDSLRVFDTNNGKLKIPGGWIRDDHPRDHPLGVIEAFAVSSNVAAAMVAKDIGCEDFYRYLLAFGFGTRTGIELEGESAGILREPEEWSKRSLVTLAIGQEIGVTALQLTMAYAAVANGGRLMKPRLVRAVIDEDGKVEKGYPAKTVRTVIGRETATEMIQLLKSVVQGGTGTSACMHGIHVAGKTGTGQKAAHGGYIAGKYNSIFAGFVPAENPKYVCVVVIDEPSGLTHYGGPVCGPVFRQVMDLVFKNSKDLIPSDCVRLTRRSGTPLVSVDAVVSMAPAAKAIAADAGVQALCPSLIGLTLMEATEVLEAANLGWSAVGSGTVLAQDPLAYAKVNRERICHLTLGVER